MEEETIPCVEAFNSFTHHLFTKYLNAYSCWAVTKAEGSVSSGHHRLLNQHDLSAMWSDVLSEEVPGKCNGSTSPGAPTMAEGLGSPMGEEVAFQLMQSMSKT